jgi:CheY-like chemotaxis protein
VKISVIDEGIGIPADRLCLLFQKFSQVDSSGARRFEGTGLGLAICRNLVELMGGLVGVASEPGRGSTFWFTLPITERPVPVENPIEEQDLDRTAVLSQKRVLLVDDNRVNRLVGQKMLERLGCSVDLALGGQEAVEMVGRCDYDLVFMDCQMPGMDGYAATRAIREAEGSRRRVPIVAFTANAMSGEQEHCLASGMDDYLTKPIRPLELKSIVTRWMVMASPSG